MQTGTGGGGVKGWAKIENREEEELTQRAQTTSAELTEKKKRAERIDAENAGEEQGRGTQEHSQEWLCHMAGGI
jgi:hypothetical protein